MICAAGARGRRHWCAATRARSRHDRGGVRGRLTRCRRSRRRSAARTDSRPTAVDKRVLSSTARDTVITFVVLEHHVVACTSPPSGRTSNGRSLRCRRTVDVNQYTVRASPRGFELRSLRAHLVGLLLVSCIETKARLVEQRDRDYSLVLDLAGFILGFIPGLGPSLSARG